MSKAWKDRNVTVHVSHDGSDFVITVDPETRQVDASRVSAYHADRVRWILGPLPDGFADVKFQIRAPDNKNSRFLYNRLKPQDEGAPEGTLQSKLAEKVHSGVMKAWVQPSPNPFKYDVVVTGTYGGNAFQAVLDPDIVVDPDPGAGVMDDLDDELQELADLMASVAPESSPFAREHTIEIEVAETKGEPGFKASIPAAKKCLTLKRSLGETVVWKFREGTPPGFAFRVYAEPVDGNEWVFQRGRYNASHAAFPSGPARSARELEPGRYSYVIEVSRRLHPRGSVIADPDIVVDDDPVVRPGERPSGPGGSGSES